MKKLISVTVAAAFSFAVSGTALADQTAVTASSSSASTEKMAKELPVRFNFEEVKTEAKIVEIDKTNRTAVLRTPDGKSVMVRVPKELKRFDQVKVGDSLTIRYNIAAAVRIEPASKNGIRELIESSTVQQSNPDEMPGIEAERRVEVLAIIQTINRKAGTVTLRGATRVVTVAVPEGINMAKLKVGDEVHAVFTDATMIDVEGKQS